MTAGERGAVRAKTVRQMSTVARLEAFKAGTGIYAGRAKRLKGRCRADGVPYAPRRSGGVELPEHGSYRAMLRRCHNRTAADYRYYGARGIAVCRAWRDPDWGYERFYAHVGPRPGHGYTLDRIDNSRGYEPGNVRWATWEQQQNNRRSNHFITIRGVSHSAAQWARIVGLPCRQLITNRIASGWHPTVAVKAPVNAQKEQAHLELGIKPARGPRKRRNRRRSFRK